MSSSPARAVPGEDDVLAEAAQAATAHRNGACLRIPVAVDTSDRLPDPARIRALLKALRLEPEQVDLLLDAGPVDSDFERDRLADRAVLALHALRPWRWRHNLTAFPRSRSTAVIHHDAQLVDCATGRRPKAGGGTEWRAWATSHHLALVTSRLAPESEKAA
ncbi:hypothetical protein [Streptomyces sp. NPDC090025]|uniref:hypothetical protein n=1 Tax=Streptomyces sp. NPDC090025 TaxID=3365922 RepID=UPI003835ED39